jgi:hypothetical protein
MPRDVIPQGTMHLLILKTLARGGEMHGYEIAESIEQRSGDVLTVEEGSLYPALQRMLAKGWVKAEWSTTRENRRGPSWPADAGRPQAAGHRGRAIRARGRRDRPRRRGVVTMPSLGDRPADVDVRARCAASIAT